MLPFRRSNRIIALDDADIVESSDLDASNADAIDVELDLDDALEISVASDNVKRAARRAPYESSPDVEEVTVARRPLSSSSMKAMTPSRTMVPALVPNSSLSYGSYGSHGAASPASPSTFGKTAPVMHIPRAVVQGGERVISGIAASHGRSSNASDGYLTPSPSPFARSIIMNGTAPKASHLMTESIAPVAITVEAEEDDRAKTHAKAARREDADVDALVAASRGTPRALRAIGLMLAGAVAAATITAFAMKDDRDAHAAAAAQNARADVSQAAALSPATFVVPMTPVIRDSVASGMNADVNGVVTAPVQVKFDESDAVLVTPTPSVAASGLAATTDSVSPVSAAKTMAAATALASASASGSAPSTHARPKHRAQPTSTGATPSNALVPDDNSHDSQRRELPKMSPAGGAKDPLAEAQLRAAMR